MNGSEPQAGGGGGRDEEQVRRDSWSISVTSSRLTVQLFLLKLGLAQQSGSVGVWFRFTEF